MNIAFTLVGLPILIAVFLVIMEQLSFQNRMILIFLLGLFMSIFERIAESFGLFVHNDSWKHIYSFFGYSVFLLFSYFFYRWINR
ncbi:CBO0543 family protein [Bacillus sp. B15-48]|uniref:CBO0543 family protein n=1 Tax=Bacillus sp. B15-48 TaxID=1548601 RepID=UPI0031B841C5